MTLTPQLVAFVQSVRTLDLRKLPSISETVDWARALILLHASAWTRRSCARPST